VRNLIRFIAEAKWDTETLERFAAEWKKMVAESEPLETFAARWGITPQNASVRRNLMNKQGYNLPALPRGFNRTSRGNVEHAQIADALKKHNGDYRAAAAELGISYNSVANYARFARNTKQYLNLPGADIRPARGRPKKEKPSDETVQQVWNSAEDKGEAIDKLIAAFPDYISPLPNVPEAENKKRLVRALNWLVWDVRRRKGPMFLRQFLDQRGANWKLRQKLKAAEEPPSLEISDEDYVPSEYDDIFDVDMDMPGDLETALDELPDPELAPEDIGDIPTDVPVFDEPIEGPSLEPDVSEPEPETKAKPSVSLDDDERLIIAVWNASAGPKDALKSLKKMGYSFSRPARAGQPEVTDMDGLKQRIRALREKGADAKRFK
jgi:hypothetical protein